MILGQASALGISGTASGLVLAGVTRSLLAPMDVSVGALAVAATVSLLVGVVLVAAWLPARVAARIDPTVALRACS
jgi:putative ABC transport system permease protein